MDIIEYFKTITKFTPIPEQEELLNALADISIKNLAVSAGRGFSKTMCAALASLWYADEYADSIGRPLEILLISSQQRMYWHIDNFFSQNKDRLDPKLKHHGVTGEVPVTKFELKNGSICNNAMPTDRSIRSFRADIVIIDECAQVPTNIIKAAMGCLTRDICKLILISTPHKFGYFTDIIDNPKEFGFTVKSWSSEVCPWQQGANKRMKLTQTRGDYAIEVLGRVPSKSERSFFPSSQVEACKIDTEPIREGKEKSTVEIGIDWGEIAPTCVTVTERLSPAKRKVLASKVWKGMIESNAKDIADFIISFNPSIIKADSRPEFYREVVQKHLGRYRIHPIDLQYHKQSMLGQLQRRIRGKELIIPRMFVDLIKELESYRYYNTIEIKYTSYKYNKAKGDDRVDSLALSCYEELSINTFTNSSGLIPASEDNTTPIKSEAILQKL